MPRPNWPPGRPRRWKQTHAQLRDTLLRPLTFFLKEHWSKWHVKVFRVRPFIAKNTYNKIIKKYPFEYRSLSYIVAALNVTSSEERGVTTAFLAGYEFNPIANPQETIIEKPFRHLALLITDSKTTIALKMRQFKKQASQSNHSRQFSLCGAHALSCVAWLSNFYIMRKVDKKRKKTFKVL